MFKQLKTGAQATFDNVIPLLQQQQPDTWLTVPWIRHTFRLRNEHERALKLASLRHVLAFLVQQNRVAVEYGDRPRAHRYKWIGERDERWDTENRRWIVLKFPASEADNLKRVLNRIPTLKRHKGARRTMNQVMRTPPAENFQQSRERI